MCVYIYIYLDNRFVYFRVCGRARKIVSKVREVCRINNVQSASILGDTKQKLVLPVILVIIRFIAIKRPKLCFAFSLLKYYVKHHYELK